MQNSGTDTLRSVEIVLLLVLLVLAPKAIWRSPLRLKAALHILAGMVVGAAAGMAIAFPTRNAEFGGHLGLQLLFCGGIFVAVHKIRRARNPRF
jgi:hypothetical protein